MTRRREQTRPEWAAYATALCAGLFASVSAYWALGGTLGLATVGGEIERMTRAGEAQVLLWGAVAGKLAGVAFALALVRPWGRVVPRRLMLGVGVAATVVLIGYGAVNVGAAALVLTGAVDPAADVDRYALAWHLWLWDAWFVVWGALMAWALVAYRRATR